MVSLKKKLCEFVWVVIKLHIIFKKTSVGLPIRALVYFMSVCGILLGICFYNLVNISADFFDAKKGQKKFCPFLIVRAIARIF